MFSRLFLPLLLSQVPASASTSGLKILGDLQELV